MTQITWCDAHSRRIALDRASSVWENQGMTRNRRPDEGEHIMTKTTNPDIARLQKLVDDGETINMWRQVGDTQLLLRAEWSIPHHSWLVTTEREFEPDPEDPEASLRPPTRTWGSRYVLRTDSALLADTSERIKSGWFLA